MTPYQTFIARAEIFWEDLERLEPTTIIENGSPNKSYDHSLEQLILEYYIKDWEDEENINDLFHWGTMKIFNQVRDKELWIEAVADIMECIDHKENNRGNKKEEVEENTMTYAQFYDKLEEYEDFYAYLNYFARDFEVWYKGGTMPLMTVNVDHVGSIGAPLSNFESDELEILELLIKIAKTPIDQR